MNQQLFKNFIIISICSIIIIENQSEIHAFWSPINNNNNNNNNRLRLLPSQQQQQSFHNNHHYKSRDVQLEDLLAEGEEKCVQKPCVQSEQCCPGSVCVDLHNHYSLPLSSSSSSSSSQSSSSLSSSSTISLSRKLVTAGTCLPIYGVNEGDTCQDDGDCENGLRCMPQQQQQPHQSQSHLMSSYLFISNNDDNNLRSSSSSMMNMFKTCQPPGQEMLKKQFNAECTTSSECDASHSLCCQLIKRHRLQSRKACIYFSDPKMCLGPVDITFASRPQQHSQSYYYKTNYFRQN